MKKLLILPVIAFLQGCAILHSVQFGEVDSEVVLKGRKFELLVSEVGVSTEEIGATAQALSRSQQGKDNAGAAAGLISLFQMGPRTGNQVYSDVFADRIFDLLRKECPSGRMSGLQSIRETAKYPIVSGEIVKITGFCNS